MIKVLIDRHITDLRAYQRARIENIEKNLEQNNTAKRIKACQLNFYKFSHLFKNQRYHIVQMKCFVRSYQIVVILTSLKS